jgi:hypothetical protein
LARAYLGASSGPARARRLSPGGNSAMNTRSVLAVAVLISTTACTVATMKPPPGVAGAKPLKVVGYSGSVQTFREKELQLGSYAVSNIDRDWDKGSSAGAGLWSRDAKKKAYRFDVKSQARTLHGECTEQAVQHSIAGFGKAKVTFGCTCSEGSTVRGKLDVVNGQGTAQVGDAALYQVATVHESEQGSTSSGALGYHFRGPQGEGAVDVGGTGRAWLPAEASEEDTFTLACQYAALFLYRPTE